MYYVLVGWVGGILQLRTQGARPSNRHIAHAPVLGDSYGVIVLMFSYKACVF